jgi:hypothetical protein
MSSRNGGVDKRARRVLLTVFSAVREPRCYYCDRVVRLDVRDDARDRAVAEHRIPLCRGGSSQEHNVVVACRTCDQAKGAMTDVEFMEIRHDQQALATKRARINAEIAGRPIPTGETRAERRQDRVERRMAGLTHRLKIPDPDCAHCGGTGLIKVNSRVDHYCPCSITDPKGHQVEELAS